MNLLFCLDTTFSRKNGGIAAVSLTLKKGLESKGHKCFLLSAKKNQEDSTEEQYYLPISETKSNIGENRIWFRDFIKGNHIDVIVNQNGGTPSSLWALKWSKDLPVRKLTVYHGDFNSLWACHKNSLLKNVFVKSFHLRPFVNYIWKNLFRLKYRCLLRVQYHLSDRLVFLSDKYFGGFEWFSGIKKDERFVSIPNPVEDIFNVNIRDLQKENIVLYVGRLSLEKRIDYLLEVWKKISEDHPDWSLYVIGDGPMRKHYENIANSLLLKNIQFEGFNPPLEYYKQSKLFCLTSETEGFGLVLVEAMSCGCVPLAFNSYASASDIIDNGESGILVPPFDVDTYAKKLSFLMDDEERLRCMAKAAKEKAKNFSLERIVTEWEKMFEDR